MIYKMWEINCTQLQYVHTHIFHLWPLCVTTHVSGSARVQNTSADVIPPNTTWKSPPIPNQPYFLCCSLEFISTPSNWSLFPIPLKVVFISYTLQTDPYFLFPSNMVPYVLPFELVLISYPSNSLFPRLLTGVLFPPILPFLSSPSRTYTSSASYFLPFHLTLSPPLQSGPHVVNIFFSLALMSSTSNSTPPPPSSLYFLPFSPFSSSSWISISSPPYILPISLYIVPSLFPSLWSLFLPWTFFPPSLVSVLQFPLDFIFLPFSLDPISSPFHWTFFSPLLWTFVFPLLHVAPHHHLPNRFKVWVDCDELPFLSQKERAYCASQWHILKAELKPKPVNPQKVISSCTDA